MAMRITNSMITMHSKTNINGTKILTDKYNEQMTSQKKIGKPSDDPVVAIRSLRLRDSLHEVEQYTDKNIPDAESWLKVTETSLTNMTNVLKDVYSLCVNGATGTLTTDDRNTILSNLEAYVHQLYSEGNTEYAGRTIFTGFKTNKTLTFQEDTADAYYSITENFKLDDIMEKTYMKNILDIPSKADDIRDNPPAIADEIDNVYLNRFRLAYENVVAKDADGNTFTPTINLTYKEDNGFGEMVEVTKNLNDILDPAKPVKTMSYADFEAGKFTIPDDAEALYIYETGEIIFSDSAMDKLGTVNETKQDLSFKITYDKKGFDDGEVRPEMYFDCTDYNTGIEFNREVQDINYTVAGNQDLNVNTQAGQNGILSTAIGRDIDELMDAVSASQKANDKVSRLKALLDNPIYAADEYQEAFKTWLTAAEKEVTYTTENLKNLFSKGITGFQEYKQTVDLAITDTGSRSSRLELTKTRMTAQKSSLQELIHSNEDRELSDILIDYETANLAYQSSLKAASEINQMTLLTYL